jgi:hypothetical protein
MKSAKQLLPTLAVLVCVSLSCTFLKDKVSDLGSQSVKAPSVPSFDPNGRLVSPGAYILRIMAKDEPAVAALTDQVEFAELKMMKEIIDEIRPKAQTENSIKTSAIVPPGRIKPASYAQEPTVAAYLMFQSGGPALPTAGDGAVFGGFTGFLKGMLAGALIEGSYNKKDSKTEPVEGGTSTMNAEMGANPDGSTVFEIGLVTETEKNGVKARTEARSRIEGQDCPNADGQVPFTMKIRLSGQSGNSKYEQEVTVLVRLVVDDNAEIASKTLDITHGTSRTRNGQTSYFERGLTYRFNAGDSEGTLSNQRVVQKTDSATLEDVTEATMSGDSVAYGAANTAIGAAESAWQGGACVQIVAESPGTVQQNSSTAIPIKVIHKKEGTELAAKLESALRGAVSIDPTLIPKTPGTITYLAPAEAGKSATITLTASCRRGRAKLDLNVDTGGKAYRVEGQSNGVSFKGFICKGKEMFTLNATFPGGTATVDFLRDSTTVTDGGGGGCAMKGAGTYKLDIDDDDTGTLRWTTTDKLTCAGGFGNSRTASFELTVRPAPDHSCN